MRLSLLLATVLSTSTFAEVKTAPIFGSGMVLQQQNPIKIWGKGSPSETVSVTLDGNTQKTTVTKDGKWAVTFAARKASFDPIALQINNQKFDNILIGEVWICSGQSNMGFDLSKVKNSKSLKTENANLRLCLCKSLRNVAKSGYNAQELKQSNVDSFYKPEWSTSGKKSAFLFSGVGWTFGSTMQQKLNVPVGLIEVAMGGSAMDSWLPAEVARKHPLTKGLYEGDWLKNDLVPEAHRKRGRDAFKTILKPGQPYHIGKLNGHRWMCEPDFLFESGIAPLKGLNFKGVLWYQGEAETQSPTRMENAKTILPLLISSWREYLEIGDFPFLLVQLPGYNRPTWPEFRETQRQTALNVANSELVVTVDLGDKKNIHPKDKIPVGERAGGLALKKVYDLGKGTFPQIDEITAKNGEITLKFKNCGKGFKAVKGKISGFEIADASGKFSSAEAKISAPDTITLKASVNIPASVRYAWQPYPMPKLVLYNSENLPLGPFIEPVK